MHIVKAFHNYCLDRDYPPLTGTEETTLVAFVVWLVQNGLLSTLELSGDEVLHPASSCRNKRKRVC